MKKRLSVISFFVLLFVVFVAIWFYSYYEGLEEAYVPIEVHSSGTFIPSESGVFERSGFALKYSEMPIDENHQRSLETYYDNRAYHGAPPSIPHPVINERGMGGDECLKCHRNGGFVKKFDTYAPVSPHPDMINCRQCHVPKKTENLFKETAFVKINAPEVGINNALMGSPPVIPHDIQMRENCLSCHAGSSAPKEIRVTHPERINCRQCHVPIKTTPEEPTVFLRLNNTNGK